VSDFTGLYDIRDYKPEDHNFILATFLRGLYYGDFFFDSMPKDIFMANYKMVAEGLINKSVIKVACLKEDPDTILGYSILSPNYQILHFVYVKNGKFPDGSSWRRKAIGRSLTPVNLSHVTHLTKLGQMLLPKLNCVFNPFQLL